MESGKMSDELIHLEYVNQLAKINWLAKNGDVKEKLIK